MGGVSMSIAEKLVELSNRWLRRADDTTISADRRDEVEKCACELLDVLLSDITIETPEGDK
tara:strand:+ start:412 stop:594 length:183 start_codon:yes stop_codon:yes gene_type:complete